MPRSEAMNTQQYLQVAMEWAQITSEYARVMRGQQGGMRKADVIREYNSIMPALYFRAGENEAEKAKIFHATLVLLHEAKDAGIRVEASMVQAYLQKCLAAGVEEQFLNGVLQRIFKGDLRLMYRVLGQEMTLTLYLEPMITSAKAFRADADDTFRQDQEKVEIAQAIIWGQDFLKQVPEPTAEQIAAQFDQYKDKLPNETPNGFGHKIPNRIRFQYLVANVADAEKLESVTDQEVKSFYETNKDRLYVVVDKPPPTPLAAPRPPSTPPTKPDAAKPAAESKDKAAGTAAKQDAKKLNAPEASPAAGEAPKPLAAASGQAAPKVVKPLALASGQEAPKPLAGPSGQEAPKPAKRYKPFEEVRDAIRKNLLTEKARKRCLDKANEALQELLRTPRLGFDNVADGVVLKSYESKGFISQMQLYEMPGIGQAGYQPTADMTKRDPLVLLAFAIDPFTKEPKVYLSRPFNGVLTDFVNNCYVFRVTAVDPAHVPPSLDEVKPQAIEDLKKEAAYTLAEKRADEVLALAAQKGLPDVIKEQKLDTAGAQQYPLTRRGVKLGDPTARAVFTALDEGRKLGKVDSAFLDRVIVFQIEKVTPPDQEMYKAFRRNVASQAIKTEQDSQYWRMTDPDMLLRRSGFVATKEQLRPREKGQPQEEEPPPPADY